jgi:cell division protein FtsI (penicillin-binding protein 3)
MPAQKVVKPAPKLKKAPPKKKTGPRPPKIKKSDAKSGKNTFLKKTKLLHGVFLLIFLLLAGRIIQIQGFDYKKLSTYGEMELVHTVSLPGQRGNIYDRNGAILAMSLPAQTLVADPFQIKDPQKEADILAPVLGEGSDVIAKELSVKSGFVYLFRLAPSSVVNKVMKLNLPGIAVIGDSKRIYTEPAITLSFLGLTNIDQRGISGLEYSLNSLLSGKNGEAIVDKAPSGADLPGSLKTIHAAHQGNSVVLTIDQSLQYYCEMAVAKEVLSTDATKGMALIQDPKTGSILAMVSVVKTNQKPKDSSFILAGSPPGPYVVTSSEDYPVDFTFEPGSVMKVATMAGALSDNLVNPNTVLPIPASLPMGGYNFQDAEAHGNETLSVTQILALSSNIGTIEIAKMLGEQRLYQYLTDFGFGKVSGLNLPGETPGILPPISMWSGSTMGSMPIGQAEAVTQIQIADAYSTIANGGIMMAPRLVSATVNPDGKVTKLPLKSGKRIISKFADKELISMFEQVVNYGTGVEAAIPGYVVAGKTGTAQIPSPTGGYIPGAFDATFVGFTPAQNPSLVGVVTIDRPNNYYGGSAAAPVFSEIMAYALHLFNIPPEGQS